MKACPEFESLLIDRAAGELGEADRLAVERHLLDCRGCAAEADALERLLSALALPPRSAEERAALASLPLRTGLAWRRGEKRLSMLKGAAAGFIATAAAAALLLVPSARREAAASTYRDPAIAALESWGSPTPFGSAFREVPLENREAALEDQGGQ